MMFEWKQNYSCNVEVIDTQHKKLFKLIDELYQITTLNDNVDHYDEIKDIFNELAEYTIYHFSEEEQLLKKHNYEAFDFKIHQLEHTTFVNKIAKVQEEDLDKNQTKIVFDVMMFAADWIENHILFTDMKYKQFLNSQGVH